MIFGIYFRSQPYGIHSLKKILEFLSSIADPSSNDEVNFAFLFCFMSLNLYKTFLGINENDSIPPLLSLIIYSILWIPFFYNIWWPDSPTKTRILALTLINIALETAGSEIVNHFSLIQVIQTSLCKTLLQISQTRELFALSLTLRAIFNLFDSAKQHLKVSLVVIIVFFYLFAPLPKI